ncbi:MAG: universal stress protein [Sphingomonadales bacterium]|nr:MAG: universal stress protein [Sphingomonadales bacterium]
MKNILVLMHDDNGQQARLSVALDLARALGGHLTCLDVVEMPPAVVTGMDDCRATAMVLECEQEREAANRARTEPQVQASGLDYEWIETTGYLSPSVRAAAGLADLIVLNREIKGGRPDMREIAGEVLIGAGRPIMAVPEQVRAFDVRGHALIAWDGSKEADAALRAAVPVLQHATAITLLEVEDGSIKLPVSEAVAYLARHGMTAAVRRESSTFDIPSTIILDMIDSLGATYLVMGGFGHSRFIEAALGGVTKRMLAECPVPVFLMH